MKTNKKVQKNSVQKSEKENAVKVTALAIIPKPMTLLTPQDVPTATEEAPQQATFKTPLATATAETDLDIATVHPSRDNHRKTFNDASLQELAESIREVGVLQAIAVRPRTEGGYEIIYGERRYRASLLAGAKTIKATIYNNVTDDEAEDMSLSENLQREQVRPTEEAKAFKRLLEKGRYDMYSLTARFGRSEKYIYTRLKLNELHAPIGELLDNDLQGKSLLDMGCGTSILAILARMRGAAHCTAVDIDEWCVRNSLENIELNGVDRISVFQGDASLLKDQEPFDVIIANINRNILLNDMKRYVSCMHPGSELYMSGFYVDDIPVIQAEAEHNGLRFVHHKEKNRWAAVKFVL